MMVQIYNLCAWEVGTRGSGVQDGSGIHETLSQKKSKEKKYREPLTQALYGLYLVSRGSTPSLMQEAGVQKKRSEYRALHRAWHT